MDANIVALENGLRAPVRRIDFDGAELFIRADGDWRGFRSRPCAKEPETVQWLRDVVTPGDVLFDIGACVGSYSLIAAALGATVHAFEPMALNYAHLQQNIWLNRLPDVTAWPVALSARTGPVHLALSTPIAGAASHRLHEQGGHLPSPPSRGPFDEAQDKRDGERGSQPEADHSPHGDNLTDGRTLLPHPNPLALGEGASDRAETSPLSPRGRELERGGVSRQADHQSYRDNLTDGRTVSPSPQPSPVKGEGASKPSQSAIAFALDELMERFSLPQPDHVKIDVDGNESLVLEGARNTLRNVRTVMVEASPDTEAAVTAILTAAGLEHVVSWPRSGNQRNHLFRR